MKKQLSPKIILLTFAMSLIISTFAFAGTQEEKTAVDDPNMAVRTGVTESGQLVVCVATKSDQPVVVKSSVDESGSVAAGIVTGSAVSPRGPDTRTVTDDFLINYYLQNVLVSTYKVTLTGSISTADTSNRQITSVNFKYVGGAVCATSKTINGYTATAGIVPTSPSGLPLYSFHFTLGSGGAFSIQ